MTGREAAAFRGLPLFPPIYRFDIPPFLHSLEAVVRRHIERGRVEPEESIVWKRQWRNGDETARQEARDRLSLLLRLVAAGDHAAMEEVYRLTSARLYGLLLRMLPERVAADEVLQETYLTVWRRADGFVAGKSSPMSWLIAIARNKAIDRLRSDSKTAKNSSLDSLVEEPVDDRPSPLRLLEADQERQQLHWCLDQLEERQREAIRSAFFSGLTYQELAERSSVPLGTMKSWIRRGLLRLKACLES